MDSPNARYYQVHFDDVLQAVDYCSEIVPHVVRRLRGTHRDGVEAPAIWFHTLPKTPDAHPGCDLLMTRGAILAALEGGMRTPAVGPQLRAVLPEGAVLVLGEDPRQAPVRKRGPRPADT